jgi:hypothetical protein
MGEEKDGQQNKPTTDVGFWTKLNPLRRGAPPPVPAERIAVSPEYTAGFFSLLTFSWMTPLISVRTPLSHGQTSSLLLLFYSAWLPSNARDQ